MFSPSEGRCCTDECNVVPADEKLVCVEDSDCRYSTTCDGSQARCPRQEYKGNSVSCDGGSKVILFVRLLYCSHFLLIMIVQ